MQYRYDRYGNRISLLGFGCMRFTTVSGRIDIPKAKSEIKAAIEGGVNYFDTAYIYPGSEAALGVIFSELNVRDDIYIASKLPHYMIKNAEGFDRIFNEELARLKTDHIDYYLIHMLTDVDAWRRVCDLGIREWISEKKKEGKIRQIGFSYHGGADMFMKIIDEYDWEFCQIQYNYLDEFSQAGVTGLKYAASKNIPVIIMEPLRGGRLSDRLPADAVRLTDQFPEKMSPAKWAFRWLYDQEEVTCVLSGMNSVEMINENIQTADESRPGMLTEQERDIYKGIVEIINKKVMVPCTGCRYCMPCPKGVDIPGCFSAYNNTRTQSLYVGLKEYVMCMVLRKNYTGVMNCVKCGKCEQHCPQHIEVRKELERVKRKMEMPPLRLVYKIASKITRY